MTTPSPTYDSSKLMSYYDRLNSIVSNAANEPNEDILVAKWNTYYYKKYQAQNNILLFIIGVCVFVIILKIMNKSFPYFDRSSYLTILGITLGLTAVVLIYSIRNIYYKDDMNFDEIDYGYNKLNQSMNPLTKVDGSFNQFNSTDICAMTQPAASLANYNFIKNLF